MIRTAPGSDGDKGVALPHLLAKEPQYVLLARLPSLSIPCSANHLTWCHLAHQMCAYLIRIATHMFHPYIFSSHREYSVHLNVHIPIQTECHEMRSFLCVNAFYEVADLCLVRQVCWSADYVTEDHRQTPWFPQYVLYYDTPTSSWL